MNWILYQYVLVTANKSSTIRQLDDHGCFDLVSRDLISRYSMKIVLFTFKHSDREYNFHWYFSNQNVMLLVLKL